MPSLPLWLETLLLLGMATLLHSTRFSWPLRWAETFYHEVSHGLAAILTGGKVVKIDLAWHGGGLCTMRGGNRFLTLLAGYTGASLWGAALFLLGLHLTEATARWWLWAELGLIAFALLFWARNLTTILILLIIGSVYAAALWLPPGYGLSYVLQVMGLFIMMNALAAPLNLIDGQHVGDGAALADLTLIIPEFIWVALWFLFAAVLLLGCLWWRATAVVPWFWL